MNTQAEADLLQEARALARPKDLVITSGKTGKYHVWRKQVPHDAYMGFRRSAKNLLAWVKHLVKDK